MPLLVVNFGGPRNVQEIAPFLEELLCDPDVVRTRYPKFFHNWLFRRIARKRALKIAPDYELIGGKSPIYQDTEELAAKLGKKTIVFHRYLPATHNETIKQIEACQDPITVFPLFPQFTYATTGSIARFFQKNLTPPALARLKWIPSYCDHPLFIDAWVRKIQEFLQLHQIQNPILFFSAHGIPKSFVRGGDPYQDQCERSYRAAMKKLPHFEGFLAYQSKFGPGEWLRPYTSELAENWKTTGKEVVFIPISFTSDHIETLFEIEHQYLPLIQKNGDRCFRCPALNLEPYWVDAVKEMIAHSSHFIKNPQLIRDC